MSQHDLNILTADANSFPLIRSQIDEALQAIASCQSGAVEPVTMYANMLWADTSAGKLTMRNTANTAWIEIGDLDTDYLGLISCAVKNTYSVMNTYQADQQLKGSNLIMRFFDTTVSKEWGVRILNGNFEVCENTNTEASPSWVARLTCNSTGLMPITEDLSNSQHDHTDSDNGGVLTGRWGRLATADLSADAANIQFSGLDGDKHEEYRLVMTLLNSGGSTPVAQMTLNGDTGSNYSNDILRYDAGGPNCGRSSGDSAMELTSFDANGQAQVWAHLSAKSGAYRICLVRELGRIISTDFNQLGVRGPWWQNAAANITSIEIKLSGGVNLKAGTRIDLWGRT